MVDVLSVLLLVMLVFIGAGLGATIERAHIEHTKKNYRSFLAGMLCQFGFMPLFAWSMAQALGLSEPLAVGAVLIGCAPGGATSNMLTYWSQGDVALSISMSLASTCAALGMLPLLILIYIDSTWGDDGFTIPYINIVLTVLTIVIPCLIGAYVKSRNDAYAATLEKMGSMTGILFLIAAIIWVLVTDIDTFKTGWEGWFLALIMQNVGGAFGYGVGFLMKLPSKDCRTIALETGVQNATLIIALIGASFDDEEQRKVYVRFPLLYGFCYILNSALTVVLFRFYLVPLETKLDQSLVSNDDVALGGTANADPDGPDVVVERITDDKTPASQKADESEALPDLSTYSGDDQ